MPLASGFPGGPTLAAESCGEGTRISGPGESVGAFDGAGRARRGGARREDVAACALSELVWPHPKGCIDDMSVFITYNHKDEEFAERLAIELVRHDIKVWKDSWRIGVGDSLIQKVQEGLEGARFFCVVLSHNSIESEWVKREITAALLREIEDRKVMILPVIVDDSRIPLLLRDKLYADFRANFNDGLKGLLATIVPSYRTEQAGRVTPDDHYYFDYSGATELVDGRPVCEIDVISHDVEESYSILTQFRLEGTEQATLQGLGLSSVSEVTELIFRSCIAEFSCPSCSALVYLVNRRRRALRGLRAYVDSHLGAAARRRRLGREGARRARRGGSRESTGTPAQTAHGPAGLPGGAGSPAPEEPPGPPTGRARRGGPFGFGRSRGSANAGLRSGLRSGRWRRGGRGAGGTRDAGRRGGGMVRHWP